MSKPRMTTSDEADQKGLELGRGQGKALTETLEHMIQNIADDGREQRVGEYLVAYAVEKAEGMYRPRGDDLEWVPPGDDNVHIEVCVRDAADGRLIPELDVTVAVLDAQSGEEIGRHRHPLLWHPYLYHYGRNWRLPGSGDYSLEISFDAPKFMRHDKENGRRFSSGARVRFDDVSVSTGTD